MKTKRLLKRLLSLALAIMIAATLVPMGEVRALGIDFDDVDKLKSLGEWNYDEGKKEFAIDFPIPKRVPDVSGLSGDDVKYSLVGVIGSFDMDKLENLEQGDTFAFAMYSWAYPQDGESGPKSSNPFGGQEWSEIEDQKGIASNSHFGILVSLMIYNLSVDNIVINGKNYGIEQSDELLVMSTPELFAATALIDLGEADKNGNFHAWNYTKQGNSIQAKCNYSPCTKHSMAMISFNVEDKVYTGSAYTGASLMVQPNWTSAKLPTPDIMYTGRGDTKYQESTTAPTAVGTYTAKIAIEDAEVTASFEITKKPGPAAPNAIGVKPSIAGGNDGKITGVDTTMEYSVDDGKTWSAVTGTEITGLSAGTVSVRVKETDTTFAGEIAKVVVPDGDAAAVETKKETSYKVYTKKSTVTVPKTTTKNGVTYTVTSLKKNAFDGKYVKKVVLPSTITKISSEAFSKDNKLRSIKITSKKLTVGKNAFKGIKKKNLAKIKVTVSKKMSKKNFKSLKKNLVKQGLKAKNIVRK